MYKVKIITLCCLISFIFSACSFLGMPKEKSDGTIDIRGTITNLVNIKDGISILVEGEKESDTQVDKASVSVGKNATILDSDNKKIKVEEIKLGYKVEITFTGPVLESYPVQATAKTVKILSSISK